MTLERRGGEFSHQAKDPVTSSLVMQSASEETKVNYGEGRETRRL